MQNVLRSKAKNINGNILNLTKAVTRLKNIFEDGAASSWVVCKDTFLTPTNEMLILSRLSLRLDVLFEMF